MADPKPQQTQQEPSMEEILASIRRIISEDETEAKSPPAEAEAPAAPQAAAQPEAPAAPPAPAAAPKPPAEPPAPAETDDVLELTDKIEGGTVVPLAGPQATPLSEDEVEIRDMADDPPPEPESEPEPEPQPDESAAEPELPRAAAPQPVAAASDLVSQATAQAATASLAALAQAVDRQAAGAPIGVGGRTLEDLVKEIMRPMIREWLDAHLPGLVERLVRREIERMGHHAQE